MTTRAGAAGAAGGVATRRSFTCPCPFGEDHSSNCGRGRTGGVFTPYLVADQGPPCTAGSFVGKTQRRSANYTKSSMHAEALEHILGGRPPTRQLSANAMLRARRRAAAMPKMAAPGGPSGAGAAAIAADRSRGRLDEYATTSPPRWRTLAAARAAARATPGPSALNPFLVMTKSKAKAKAKAKPKAAAERNDADNRTHGGRRRYSRRRRRRKQKSRKRRR